MILKKLFIILIFLFIGLIEVKANADTGNCTPPFTDVSCDYWAINYISAVKDAGITKGCNPPQNDRFCPEDVVTRAQMAAFIIRAIEGEPTSYNANPYFADVPPAHWAFKYVQRVRERGIAQGYPGTNLYGPEDNVTREQMAKMLIMGLVSQGKISEPPTDYCASGSPFTDVDPSSWSCRYIKRLKELEITQGCNPPQNDRYCPQDRVTRAQMAAFIYRGFLSSNIQTSLSGTAATGKALASTAIYLKDAQGKIKSTITDANGKFTFDTSDLTPPFYLRTQGFGLFSYTEQKNGTANITPLTAAVVAIANNGNPDIYNNPSLQLNLDNAKNSLKTFLAPVLQKYNVQDADFISTPFEANGQGMDALMDSIFISVSQDSKTIEIKNPFTGETIGTGIFNNGSIAVADPINDDETNRLPQSPLHRKYFGYVKDNYGLPQDGPFMLDIVYDVDGKISVAITATEGDTGDIFFIYGNGQKTGNSISFTAPVILCHDTNENGTGIAEFVGTIDNNGNISGTFRNTLSAGDTCKVNNSNVYEGTFIAEDVTDVSPINVAGIYDGYATPTEWPEEGPATLEISQNGNSITVSITAISDTGQQYTRIGLGTVYGNYLMFRVPIILCHDTCSDCLADFATFFGKFDSNTNTISGIYGDGVPDGDYCKALDYDSTKRTTSAEGFWRAVKK